MEAKTISERIMVEHKEIQKSINKEAKTRLKRVRVTATFPYNLRQKCQKDLNILAGLTEVSQTPGIFDKSKDIVFRTLGYCVGEAL